MKAEKFKNVCVSTVIFGTLGGAVAVWKRIWDDGLEGHTTRELLTDYAKGFTLAAAFGAVGSSLQKKNTNNQTEAGK